MKKILITLLVCMSCIYSNAQELDPRITEVYADKSQELVSNDPDRLRDLTDILQNRLKVVLMPAAGDDKFPRLSQMPLLNKYNPDLKRDKIFDINAFNPLKYNLNFFPRSTTIYRVDNSDYVIIIEPQSTKH